ncbi:MAG: hypothetical protein BIFFINMI_00761 [Phycisphaerae bacterium]|nr:hypothetical protein [Phycisphaerae bacterium]
MPTFNVYCDESCHLEGDKSNVMVIGAVWCLADRVPEISERLVSLRRSHGLSPWRECKWTKVSKAKLDYYLDLVDYFFDNDGLHFRGVVVQNKKQLDHDAWAQSHDDWYYKMFFHLLSVILDPREQYRIYLDYKDSYTWQKGQKLAKFLRAAKYDKAGTMVERIQPVRSHESALIQLTDLLIGAIGYLNRELKTSAAKIAVIKRIQSRSGYSLIRSTTLGERKFNLLAWQPREGA